jgi:hypothetical protein
MYKCHKTWFSEKYLISEDCISEQLGHAIAQAVNRRLPIVAARVRV